MVFLTSAQDRFLLYFSETTQILSGSQYGIRLNDLFIYPFFGFSPVTHGAL